MSCYPAAWKALCSLWFFRHDLPGSGRTAYDGPGEANSVPRFPLASAAPPVRLSLGIDPLWPAMSRLVPERLRCGVGACSGIGPDSGRNESPGTGAGARAGAARTARRDGVPGNQHAAPGSGNAFRRIPARKCGPRFPGAPAGPLAGTFPPGLFLNEVLPYASLNEPRDNWRKRLHEICQPLVKDCKTPAEAGKALNQTVVRASQGAILDETPRAVQGPFETMESGLATCTGLSILLVDACRSVGVPARIAATPLWFNNSGNHTWVEIWDGDWHFTGAAEQSPEGPGPGLVRRATPPRPSKTTAATRSTPAVSSGPASPFLCPGRGGSIMSAPSMSRSVTPPGPAAGLSPACS